MFFVGVRGDGAFFATIDALVSSRISLMTTMALAEDFVTFSGVSEGFVELLELGAHLALSLRENATKC